MAFKDNAKKVQEKTSEATTGTRYTYTTTGTTYTYTISNVKEVTDTMVSFRLVINGITIYMKVVKYKSKKTGEEGMMVSFPSRKGNDNKYYNEVYFPMTKEMSDDIINKVLEAL